VPSSADWRRVFQSNITVGNRENSSVISLHEGHRCPFNVASRFLHAIVTDSSCSSLPLFRSLRINGLGRRSIKDTGGVAYWVQSCVPHSEGSAHRLDAFDPWRFLSSVRFDESVKSLEPKNSASRANSPRCTA
jgi:hypothetical protein